MYPVLTGVACIFCRIRATSPKTNCSKITALPLDGQLQKHSLEQHSDDTHAIERGGEYPAYTTCSAGRPDHGIVMSPCATAGVDMSLCVTAAC